MHALTTHRYVLQECDSVGFKGVSLLSADETDSVVMLVALHQGICEKSDKN